MRITSIALLVCAVLTAGLAGCGGSEDRTPGTPTQPTPVPTSISISPGTDLIKIKGAESFTASAAYADGRTAPCEASWRTDNAATVTVTMTGRATGEGPGEATVTAECQGVRVTRPLRVVPDYHGRWSGSYRVTTCTDDGDWHLADFCKDVMEDGTPLIRLSLGFTQTRDVVTGTGDFGDPVGPVDGNIRMTGHLVLTATLRLEVEGLTFDARVTDYESLSTDNERMTGQFVLTFTHPALKGSARFTSVVDDLRKTSATPLTAIPQRGVSDLLRTLRRRLSR